MKTKDVLIGLAVIFVVVYLLLKFPYGAREGFVAQVRNKHATNLKKERHATRNKEGYQNTVRVGGVRDSSGNSTPRMPVSVSMPPHTLSNQQLPQQPQLPQLPHQQGVSGENIPPPNMQQYLREPSNQDISGAISQGVQFKKEGFTNNYIDAGGAKDKYQPIGAFDGVVVPTGNNVSSWRYTAPNEKLLGAEFTPGDDSLFIFKNNQCKPECCGSSASCSGGCVCTTPQQRDYIASRGGNVTKPLDNV